MRLAQEGGSFDFQADPRKDVYSVEDLKIRSFLVTSCFRAARAAGLLPIMKKRCLC